jgi:hypothetical protein
LIYCQAIRGSVQQSKPFLTLKDLDDSLQRAITEYNTTKKQMAQVFQEVYSMIKYEKPEKSIIDQFYSEFNSQNVNNYLKKINEMKSNSYENP